MKKIITNTLAVFLGLITVVAISIVLSLFSIVIFSGLIKSSPSFDILVTSTGPLLYSLFTILVAIAVGVFVASKVSGGSTLVNAGCVAILYGGFTYLLSQSPSNLDSMYPDWYVLSSYLILLPCAYMGHVVSIKLAS